MKVAIVGSDGRKMTGVGEVAARLLIDSILSEHVSKILVSGGCPLGGVDTWAEEYAKKNHIKANIYRPKVASWSGPGGFRDRNYLIARDCDEIHVIVVRAFAVHEKTCYHCAHDKSVPKHIASGACWTGRKAMSLGKKARWYIVDNK